MAEGLPSMSLVATTRSGKASSMSSSASFRLPAYISFIFSWYSLMSWAAVIGAAPNPSSGNTGIITRGTTERITSSDFQLSAMLTAWSRACFEGSEPSNATRIFLYIYTDLVLVITAYKLPDRRRKNGAGSAGLA